MSLAAWRRN